MKKALPVIFSALIIFLILIILISLSLLNENKNSEKNNPQIKEFENKTVGIIENSETEKYPWHKDIWATEFWIGEAPSSDNSYISNAHSAWDEKWVEHYGGIDNPKKRNGYHPAGFIPKENPFYCALPYGDEGEKSNLKKVYWYQPDDELKDETSILKNRWIEVRANNRSCYCQWEDVGPEYSDDIGYVFGSERPLNEKDGDEHKSGLDISPAMRAYLGISGLDLSSWRFADQADVPEGPWKEIITGSDTCWIYPESDCK